MYVYNVLIALWLHLLGAVRQMCLWWGKLKSLLSEFATFVYHVAEFFSPRNTLKYVNTCNDIIFTLSCYLASPRHTRVMHRCNECTRMWHRTNASTRISHTFDRICHVNMFYDVIISNRHKIALSSALVSKTKTIWRGKVGTRGFGACNVTTPITSIYCNW